MKEVLGYDIMDGRMVNSFLITKLIYPVTSVYKKLPFRPGSFILSN